MSMSAEAKAKHKNRPFRILALLCVGVILSTLVSLFQLAKSNGSLRYWHVHGFIVSCAGCVYMLTMTYYVKRQRDRTRRVSEDRYRSIIAISDMGAWEYDSETGKLWCSPEYFHMLGYNEQTFLKKHPMTIDAAWINRLHPEDRRAAIQKFVGFSSETGGSLYENTFRLRHRKGTWIWILSRSKALTNGDGTRSKVMLGSHIDITEKIATQIELHKRNQKLVNFAFSNAHHVRGPVARMLGLVELVKIDKETDRQWYVETISDEVKELDKITKSIARELDEIEELP